MDSNDVNDTEELVNDEELMDNNDIPSEEPPLEENEGQMDIEPPKSGNFLGVASKKIINLLLKKKLIAIGIVGSIVLLFIVIFFGANVSTETYNYKYMESLKDKCEKVEVVYEPYGSNDSETKTMDLEKYIGDATYSYTKDFKNIDEGTYHLYKALAIALRTEVVSNGCKITYRDKELSNRPSDGKYNILNNALVSSEGVIMSKTGKKKIMSVSVSDFCYSQNDGENYSIFQVPDFYIPTSWVNKNVPSRYKDCPCNQPDESLSSCYVTKDFKEWAHQDDTSGFNVYAAYYLLDEYKLSWSDILKYFVGDHNYWTIKKDKKDADDEANLEENCGAMDLHKTTLTKEQFVAGIKNFKYDGNIPEGWKLFVENAELIYDVSKRNNINPEFVIVRGILEGFNPDFDEDGNRQLKYHNFWGWECFNGISASQCAKFGDTFEIGVEKYCQEVYNQYTDYEDLLRRYAYLGDYWYNPGDSGLGGCHYASSIYPNGLPSRVQKACSGPACSKENTANCTKTTAEDQLMYGKFQDRNFEKYRKAIWNISETDCKMTASGAGCMWWPIGSKTKTEKDGVTYASDDPETTTITSGFGKRDAPTANASTYHNAIDIGGGREGQTNVIAAADGTVTNIITGCTAGVPSCGGYLGNAVYITHSDGSQTRYGHLYSVAVKNGDSVKQGQVIGKLGNTGNSTGPHLDFQVKVNGEEVDPTNYVSAGEPRKLCSGSGSVVSGDSNKQTICLTLKNSGYSNEAVAGIMGNLQQESGFMTNNTDGKAHGIAQWQEGRFVNLKSTYGSGWTNLDNQLKFLLSELNGDYASADKYLREDHSARDQAFNFCMVYEGPGESDCKNTPRMSNAEELLSYVENGCE